MIICEFHIGFIIIMYIYSPNRLILEKRNLAAIVLQKNYRMRLAMLEKMKLKEQKSAVIIQKFWRGYQARKEIKKLHLAATQIQKTWKGACVRASYVRTLSYIIDLQSWFRMILAKRQYQQMLNERSQAALIIQTNFRRHAAQNKLYAMKRENAKKKNDAATVIQKHVKMYLAKKKFIHLKGQMEAERLSKEVQRENATLILQHAFKGWRDRLAFLRKRRAATLIKATWRSFKVRQVLKKAVIAKQLEIVQRRVSEAHKNATEDKKLCNRTAFALDYLFTYKDMAMLIEALTNLNVSLRYSTNCCLRMFEGEGKAVEILVNLLNGLNRSVPHIEVMSIVFDIFISIAEFHETRPQLVSTLKIKSVVHVHTYNLIFSI